MKKKSYDKMFTELRWKSKSSGKIQQKNSELYISNSTITFATMGMNLYAFSAMKSLKTMIMTKDLVNASCNRV